MPGIVLALLAAVLDLLAVAFGLHALRVVTKPLPALILAVTARSRRPLAVGLILAAAGDELLLGNGDIAFLAGMLAFAGMHVAYIAAYLRFSRPFRLTGRALGIGAFYVVILMVTLSTFIAPYAGSFAAPLYVYGLLLVAMASCALAMPALTAIGGAVFICSDTLLAFAKFYPSFPLPPRLTELAVMGTYFLAQVLIVSGMTDATFREHPKHLTTVW